MELPKIELIKFDGLVLTLSEEDNTIEAFQRLIGCDTFQGLSSTELGIKYGLDIYLDDNGKLYGQDTITGLFVRDGKVIDYMVGTLLIMRHDDEGDSISATDEDMLNVSQYLRPGSTLVTFEGFPFKVAENLLVLPC